MKKEMKKRVLKHSVAFSQAKLLSLVPFFSNFQRIRDLEDKTDIQKRQIKDLEEKVGFVLLLKQACFESNDLILLNYMDFLIPKSAVHFSAFLLCLLFSFCLLVYSDIKIRVFSTTNCFIFRNKF